MAETNITVNSASIVSRRLAFINRKINMGIATNANRIPAGSSALATHWGALSRRSSRSVKALSNTM